MSGGMARAGKAARAAAVATLCAVLVGLGLAGPAWGAADDPLFVFTPHPEPPQPAKPPPWGLLEGPCGLAVDSAGNFYVSDYYNDAIDAFGPSREYLSQVTSVDPLDGPCGLALNSAGWIFANVYHRSVVSPPIVIDPEPSTGVAVSAADDLYVDERTSIAGFGTGAPVKVAAVPLRIGAGSLEDGYGLAVSDYPGTAGRLYVPDAGDDTVKVYDPALDTVHPVATIDGHGVPGGGFVSLRDSAVAVDRVSGVVYVADNLQQGVAEAPEAAIYAFAPGGAYLGRLKYNIVDALPPGLAVDNSAEATQGRVYVTSGNTELASIYAYPPGAETDAAVPALRAGAPTAGALVSAVTLNARALEAAAGSRRDPEAAASEVAGQGNLRLALDGELTPRSLPRRGDAPVSVALAWKLSTSDGSSVPPLRKVRIEINRHGRFDYRGLPTCSYAKIQPASTERALANCREGLVGRGRFTAVVALAGQESYLASGQMLVFNGRQKGKPVLFGQIYSPYPFANSFVIVFDLERLAHGTYGTVLSATLPPSLRSWGNLTEIRMRLSRRFRYRGKRHSFIAAGCPAAKGFSRALFPLARTTFTFFGDVSQSLTLIRGCRTRG
jgi:hypothetical protein